VLGYGRNVIKILTAKQYFMGTKLKLALLSAIFISAVIGTCIYLQSYILLWFLLALIFLAAVLTAIAIKITNDAVTKCAL